MDTTLAASAVDQAEMDQVRALATDLPQGSPLAVLLQALVSAVSRGVNVTMLESDAEMTPNQAAELLNMSRPHLLKLMDRGELDFHRVGTNRRIPMASLLDFIDRRERAKADVAHALGTSEAITQRVRDEAGMLTDEDLAELDAL